MDVLKLLLVVLGLLVFVGGVCIFFIWLLRKLAPSWSGRVRSFVAIAVPLLGICGLIGIWTLHTGIRPPTDERPVPPADERPPPPADERPRSKVGHNVEVHPTTGSGNGGDGNQHIPQFPWPPPPPSALIVIPREVFLSNLHEMGADASGQYQLKDVDLLLRESLEHGGYYQMSYYSVPQGFALVARLERINPDGSPFSGSGRFNTSFYPLEEFTVSAYLHALSNTKRGKKQLTDSFFV